jgi:hypothetical protein
MLKQILATQILTPNAVCINEAAYLIKQYDTAQLALQRFIEGVIDFADYCDILQLCEVNVDDFLINVEQNLEVDGLI